MTNVRKWRTRLLHLWLPLGFFLFIGLAPFYWMLITSLKPNAELYNTRIMPLIVYHPTLKHYVDLLTETSFLTWTWNTTLVAVAVIWRYLFNTRYGLLNYALGGIGIDPIDWLGDPHWAMPAIILFAIWKNFGYNMIILLAGLQSIPEELYEAAQIDGASIWRQFRSVTLPMLSPVVLLVSILTIAGYFQLFAEPYVMTQGGPLQSTVSVLYFMYEEGFKWWNLGSASAVAFVLFLLIFAFTALQLRGKRWTGE